MHSDKNIIDVKYFYNFKQIYELLVISFLFDTNNCII